MTQVSIVMPTWNRLQYLGETLDSIRAQQLTGWELIIADDGSSAAFCAALRTLEQKDPKISLVLLEHSGNPPAVRNAALGLARGEFIAFMDSDDLWLPQKLQRQIAALEMSPGCGWSFTGFQLVDGDGRARGDSVQPQGGHSREQLLTGLLDGSILVTQSSVVVRRELFESVNGYDTRFPVCGDYELWLRLAQRSAAAIIAEPLVRVRRHKEHYSDDVSACADFLAVLRETRRRGIPKEFGPLLNRRCANAAATLARSCARSGMHLTLLRAIAESASFGWNDSAWWRGIGSAARRLIRRVPLG